MVLHQGHENLEDGLWHHLDSSTHFCQDHYGQIGLSHLEGSAHILVLEQTSSDTAQFR